MSKTNMSFDSMMREAMGGIGTSMSFTRRLMVRIEKEREMAREARLARILKITAIAMGGILTLGVVAVVVWAVDVIPNMLYSFEDIVEYCSYTIEQTYFPRYVVWGLTLVLGMMAFVALDRVLKKEYK